MSTLWSMLRRTWPAAVAFVLVAAAILVMVGRPAGDGSARLAALGAVQDDARPGSAEVLLERPWGEGRFVVVRYDASTGHQLALVFAIDQGRGWRAARMSAQRAEVGDVQGRRPDGEAVDIGSLLVASSPGGAGQPSWSAVFGELSSAPVVQVDVRWATGDVTRAERTGDAYLVLQRGQTQPVRVRYAFADGSETKVEVSNA